MHGLTTAAEEHDPDGWFDVLIAGAGVAGLEAAFALRELAGAQVRVTIAAPTDEFVYRPMSIAEPFTSGRAQHYSLPELAARAHANLRRDALVKVDAENQRVETTDGTELSYDALLICLGATAHARYEHATTIDDAHMDELLHGLLQDIEGGYVSSLAMVVPAPMPWPLPAYEFALMASERAWDMQADMSVTLITPEDVPLASFGPDAGLALARLLDERKIDVVTSAECEIPKAQTVQIHPRDRPLHFDRIIALPELRGSAVAGLPHDDRGFIPIDDHTRVPGVKRVWAAGDTTNFPVKHGGVAAQMAHTAAQSIAAAAGAAVEPERFDPVLEGVLLTGGKPRYLRGRAADGTGTHPEVRTLEHGDEPPKIAARYLAPHLLAIQPTDQRRLARAPSSS